MKELLGRIITGKVTDEKKPQLKEVSEVKWFKFDEAIEKITFDNSKVILNRLKEDLNLV